MHAARRGRIIIPTIAALLTAGTKDTVAPHQPSPAYGDLEARARQSKGGSAESIYRMIDRALSERGV